MDTLRVAYWPDFSVNPYLRLLYEGARAWDVQARPWGRSLRPLAAHALAGKAPDLLHLHWVHPAWRGPLPLREARIRSFLATLHVVRARGARVVWTCHNLEAHEEEAPALDMRMRRLLAARVDALIVHSEAAAAAVRERIAPPGADIRIVPHGHYLSVYTHPPRADARARLGIAAGDRVLLAFGLVRRHKGLPELVRDFREVAPARGAQLWVVGEARDAELAAELHAARGDDPRVRLVFERVPDAELGRYFAAADLAALPFRRSLTSGSLMLALSMGRAVLAPALPTVTELVPDVPGNLLYPARPGALKAALARALRPDTPLAEAGEANLRVARERPWSLAGERLRAVYDAALLRRSAG